jgi:hypothetical protein
MKRLLATFFVLFMLVSPVWGAGPYYIRDDGNDGNTGLSHAQAWKTLAKATSLAAGSDVYLMVEDTWTSERINVNWTGSSGDRVIIGAYDNDGDLNDDIVGNRPVIEGVKCDGGTPYPSNSWNALLHVDGDGYDYITFQDIEMKNSNGGGVFVDGSDYVTVQRCKIDDVRYSGIQWYSSAHDGVIDSNEVLKASNRAETACGEEGAYSAGIATSSNCNNVLIKRNKVYNTWGEGIGIYKQSSNNIVEDNVVYCTMRHMIYTDRSAATIIRRNLVYYVDTSGNADDFSYGSYEGQGSGPPPGIIVAKESTSNAEDSTGTEIYNNLVAATLHGININASENDANFDNLIIANNTFVDCTNFIKINVTGDDTGWKFQNNLFYDVDGDDTLFHADTDASPTSWTISHNLWYAAQSGGTYDDWSANEEICTADCLAKTSGWKALTAGVEDGSNFVPDSGSNAINNGTFVSSDCLYALYETGTDYTASPITVVTASQDDHGASWEIGAFVEPAAAPGGEDYSDITMWWRCEEDPLEADNGDYPDAEDPTMTGAALSDTAEKIGTYGILIRADNQDKVSFTPSLLPKAKGRVGFYFYIGSGDWHAQTTLFKFEDTTPNPDDEVYVRLDGSDELQLVWYVNSSLEINKASDDGAPSADLSDATWYFLEVEWDATADTAAVYVDGVEVITHSGTLTELGTLEGFIIGNYGKTSPSSLMYIDQVMVSDLSVARDFYDDIYQGTALRDVTGYPTAAAPSITDVGHIADPTGTPAFTADKTETWNTKGDLKYVGLAISEELTVLGNPTQSYLSLAPTIGAMVGKYFSHIEISNTWYLVYEFKVGYTWDYTSQEWDEAFGHRGADLQTAAVGTALQLNTATMEDGDSNSLVTTLSSTDIGTITLANPKKNWLIQPAGGDYATYAAFTAAAGNDVPGDRFFINGTTETITATASGTATNPIIFMVYGLTGDFDVNNKDYVIIQGVNNISGSISNTGTGYQGLYFNPLPGL